MRPHPCNQARRRSQMRPCPFPTGQASASISDREGGGGGASGSVPWRSQPHPCPVGPALAQIREGDRMRLAPGP